MAQTVVGMFESSSKAQEAVQELVQTGITRDRIDVSSGNSGSSYSSASTGADNDEHHESGISKFFKSLFGSDEDDADKYTRVASSAQSIVTVHAQSSDEAERVADILDDNGAVDVDEHASKLGYNKTGSSGSYGSTGSASATAGGSGYSNSSLATDATTGLAGVGAASLAGGTSGLGGSTSGLTGSGSSDLGGTSGLTGSGTSGLGTGTTGLSSGSDLEGTSGTTGYTGTTGTDMTNTTGEGSRIPIIEENLEVGKREVRTGGVRVRSRIIERPVEESVRLREERVNIERTPVDRPASESDLQNFQEREIEMVEHAEVPVVSKEARVVEEINVGKEVEERNETIQDTVRKTEVDVENLEKDNVRGRSSSTTNTDSNL